MDNEKAIKIVRKVVIILLVMVAVGFAYWYVKQMLDEKGPVVVYKEPEIKVLDLSTPVTEYINKREQMGNCTEGDCLLYMDVKLPKINATTSVVKSINNRIEKIYKDIENYFKGEKKLSSFETSYEYKYVWSLRYLYVTIVKKSISTHEKSDTTYVSYIYDEKNDRELTMQNIIEYFGGSLEKVKEKIKLNPDIDSQLKESANSIDVNKDLSIISLDDTKVVLRVILGEEEYKVTFSKNEQNLEGLVTDNISEKKTVEGALLDVKIPKIKLETTAVTSLNQDMKKVYDDIISYYSEKTEEKKASCKVIYQYGYSNVLSYIYITIMKTDYKIEKDSDNKDITVSNNTYYTYIYDASADEVIKKEDLLLKYKVTSEGIIDKIMEENGFSETSEEVKELKILVENNSNILINSIDLNKITVKLKAKDKDYLVSFEI